MPHAELGPIAVHLPERVETNEALAEQYPRWDLKLIAEKTGIHQRHIAAPEETASDLAVAAAEKLFSIPSRSFFMAIFSYLLFMPPSHSDGFVDVRIEPPARCQIEKTGDKLI